MSQDFNPKKLVHFVDSNLTLRFFYLVLYPWATKIVDYMGHIHLYMYQVHKLCDRIPTLLFQLLSYGMLCPMASMVA